jgi:hypothetical protein
MGRTKVKNQTYSKAINIHKKYEHNPSCPDIPTIERLLKDHHGDADSVEEIVLVLVGAKEAILPERIIGPIPELRATIQSAAAAASGSDKAIRYEDEFNAFAAIMAGILTKDQMMEIWMIACESPPSTASYKERLMTADKVLLTAVDFVFTNMAAEDVSWESSSATTAPCVDPRSAQEAVQDMLFERFQAHDDADLQIVIACAIIDCDGDIDAAAARISTHLSSTNLSFESTDFPTIEDAAIINKFVGDSPLPSCHSKVRSGYKSATLSSSASTASPVLAGSSRNPSQPNRGTCSSFSKPKATSSFKSKVVVAPVAAEVPKATGSCLNEYWHWRNIAAGERVMMMQRFAHAASSYSKQRGLSGYISDCGRDHQQNILNANLHAARCALQVNNPRVCFDLDRLAMRLTFDGFRPTFSAGATSPRRSLSIDLHLLTVMESIQVVEAVSDWIKKNRGLVDEQVVLIVGQGKHSAAGVAILGPALMRYLQPRAYTSSYSNAVITTTLR